RRDDGEDRGRTDGDEDSPDDACESSEHREGAVRRACEEGQGRLPDLTAVEGCRDYARRAVSVAGQSNKKALQIGALFGLLSDSVCVTVGVPVMRMTVDNFGR